MKLTLDKVKELQAQLKDTVGERPADAKKTRVLVGMATCGLASGAGKVMNALKMACETLGIADEVELVSTGCIRFVPVRAAGRSAGARQGKGHLH